MQCICYLNWMLRLYLSCKALRSFTCLHMRVSGSQEHRRFGIFVVSHGGRLTYSKTFAYSQGRTRVHGAEPLNVASLPFFTSGK